MEDQYSPSSDMVGSHPPSGTRVRQKRIKKVRRKHRPAWRRMIARWTNFDASDLAGALGCLIEGLVISMLVLAPLPLGSVAPWAQSALFLCACLLLFLWAARAALQGRVEIVKTPLWFFAAGYLLILGMQMIPLPHFLLAILSPRAAELYAGLVPGYPDASGPMPLSLNFMPWAESGGIFTSTVPDGVGHFTFAPRTASQGATGRSR
jgi:hypothetical protein